MTGEGRRGQREARKEGKNTKKRKQRKQMNKFMGHKMKRKTEGRKGAGVISGRFLLSGHRRCTQKHGEDSIKYHMQWPYCHGYGRVENINQALTCNRREDGGRRDGGKTAIGDGRRLAQHVFTVRVCVCLTSCVFSWARSQTCMAFFTEHVDTEGEFFFDSWISDLFWLQKSIFKWKKKKLLPRSCHQARLTFTRKSEINSFHTGLNSRFTNICFRGLSLFQVEFICAKKEKKKKEVCSCSLSHREEKKHV